MKTKYNIRDKVFALNTFNDKPISIEIVIIDSISIDDNGIYYGIVSLDNEDWGVAIPEINVSKNINNLSKRLKL